MTKLQADINRLEKLKHSRKLEREDTSVKFTGKLRADNQLYVFILLLVDNFCYIFSLCVFRKINAPTCRCQANFIKFLISVSATTHM